MFCNKTCITNLRKYQFMNQAKPCLILGQKSNKSYDILHKTNLRTWSVSWSIATFTTQTLVNKFVALLSEKFKFLRKFPSASDIFKQRQQISQLIRVSRILHRESPSLGTRFVRCGFKTQSTIQKSFSPECTTPKTNEPIAELQTWQFSYFAEFLNMALVLFERGEAKHMRITKKTFIILL